MISDILVIVAVISQIAIVAFIGYVVGYVRGERRGRAMEKEFNTYKRIMSRHS